MAKIAFTILLTNIFLHSASFDCQKASSYVEKQICKKDKLSCLDDKLNHIYKDFRLITKEIKADQIKWLKKRNTCKDEKCIKLAYKKRIKELSVSLTNQKTFPKLYLDAMKDAQENMKIVWNPIIDDKKDIEKGLKFKDDLFRFNHITFKPALISNVAYYIF